MKLQFNPLPDTCFPQENPDPEQVDPVIAHTTPAAPELAELAAVWHRLPDAVRAGIVAMVRASQR